MKQKKAQLNWVSGTKAFSAYSLNFFLCSSQAGYLDISWISVYSLCSSNSHMEIILGEK